jgi:catechol 2,3-dioxygenase-like lactoylglutathione lyase family enzyme
MAVGSIEAVRVFTTRLADACRFYAEALGLNEVFASDAVVMFMFDPVAQRGVCPTML